jgi:outer membrane receptor protein involved in Fe transport
MIMRAHRLARAVRGSMHLSILAVAVTGANAYGQGAVGDGDSLEEIVVTAQKRAQNLQDVPMGISAMTGAGLDVIDARTVSDIARFVPGLTVANTGPGQSQVIVRGISSGISLPILGNVATVGYYLDEAPVSDLSRNLDAALVDLERVEVLRGPQGTLYGSSSMGGTIRYISHRPDLNEFSGSADVTTSHTQGSGELNKIFDAVINVPLVSDVLAVRAAGFYQGWSGYIDRYSISPAAYQGIDPNVPVQKDANTSRLWGGRVSLEYKPNEHIDILPAVLLQKTEIDAPFTFDSPAGSTNHPIQVRFVPEPASDDVKLATLTAKATFNEFEIVSATSYFDRVADSIEDWSKLAAYLLEEPPFPFYQFTRYSTKSWTEELRASYTGERLSGVVGVYYQRRDNGLIDDDPVYPGYNEKFGTDIDSFFTTDENTETKERAVFGELNYKLTQQLTATVGDRASHTEQTHAAASDGYFNGGPSANSNTTISTSNTPKVGLSYQVTPEALLYATAAKGARPGGAQHYVPVPFCAPDLTELGLSAAPTKYSPDSLWSYEIGSKNRFDDGRITLNGSVYYIDWKNIQQEVDLSCGFPVVTNFGKATSKGAELEGAYHLARGWTVSANASYTDATAGSETFGIPVQIGDPLLNTPRWAYAASADYTRPLTQDFEFTGHLDYSYSGWTAAVFDKTSPFYRRPSYNLVNLTLGLRNLPQRWQAKLFVDNLTNKHADTGVFASNTGNNVLPPDVKEIGLNRPRTVGIRVEYKF